MKSLGHELGILFGFLVACFVVMGVYVYVWHGEFRLLHPTQPNPPSFTCCLPLPLRPKY
ncbi:hypothetical protein BO86DRAFT_384778 [Aspergillus japonicus CBS 114.51]|uniref:Uncharacterized protein n=1 Tax=Aspergillus japonicus CBS 114.51 TaxID=1448312 RepID=A0A8T8XIJ1_ASPJA|nr:hypothetical protein BO86DRAFT_384778 [Aspergillus japonicus CBS 114.51]RAH87714.1 hypothetical protein BO86DRAFT_384778 [Aspergillus japonicus CBS 114.51]